MTQINSGLGSTDFLSQLAATLQVASIPTIVTLGLIANALSFTVMSLRKNRVIVMYFYVKVLAVSDTLALLMYVPRFVMAFYPRWTEYESLAVIYCIGSRYFADVCYGAAMWFVVIIAVDRVIAVRFPLQAKAWCTMGRARRIAIILGIAVSCFNIPSCWRRPMKFGVAVECILVPSLLWFEQAAEGFNTATPVILILILNIAVITSVRSHNKKMKRSLSTTIETAQDGGMTAMLILVATAMFVLNIPYFFFTMTWTYIIPDFTERYPSLTYFLIAITSVLWMSNNSINFFLYCLASRHFRQDLLGLFIQIRRP